MNAGVSLAGVAVEDEDIGGALMQRARQTIAPMLMTQVPFQRSQPLANGTGSQASHARAAKMSETKEAMGHTMGVTL
jgi:hypothetical protein